MCDMIWNFTIEIVTSAVYTQQDILKLIKSTKISLGQGCQIQWQYIKLKTATIIVRFDYGLWSMKPEDRWGILVLWWRHSARTHLSPVDPARHWLVSALQAT